MSQIKNKVADQPEMASLLLGAGFALASLILLPAVAQKIGMGSSLTIALRGALMRAAQPALTRRFTLMLHPVRCVRPTGAPFLF